MAGVTPLLSLLETLASVPSEPGYTELDHALQCAQELSMGGADDELVVAGLCHDVGHRFGPDEAHGVLGAEFVAPVLGPRVAALVEAHVPAKRYLSRGRYALSPGSAMSLARQGGPMDDASASAFEQLPWLEDAVRLRRADDAAKVPGREVPGLDYWAPMLERMAAR